MRIIPAIDVIDGKCVRLSQGDYAQKTIYNENPLEVAKRFEGVGIKYLHLVDLDGAKAGRVINWSVIENITGNTNLSVDFGGGVKTDDELDKLFDLGVKQVNLGSIAVRNTELVESWIKKYGSEQIILSADVKNEKIAISGWMENSAIDLSDFIGDYLARGLRYVTCTDIATDGMLQGPNLALYKKLMKTFPSIRLTASGGVSGPEDLDKLADMNLYGVIVGKAIYEGKIPLPNLVSL